MYSDQYMVMGQLKPDHNRNKKSIKYIGKETIETYEQKNQKNTIEV